ncbi:MAG: S8 family serine peptidase [Clostridia bacterium]|nr:S8 family serine peptidase [Clostridia bacterium]
MERYEHITASFFPGKGGIRKTAAGKLNRTALRLVAAVLLLSFLSGLCQSCFPCLRNAVAEGTSLSSAGSVNGHYYDHSKSGLNGEQEGVMRMQEARSLFMAETDRREAVEPVNVGVLDTLFAPAHKDLRFAGLFYNCAEGELPAWIREEKGTKEQLSHGTHVAGIIGAVNNNGIGIDGAYPLAYDRKTGVSHLYGCSSWLGRPKDDTAGRPERIANSLDLLAQLDILFANGVKVINYSMGSGMEGWGWFLNEEGEGEERREEYGDALAEYLQGKLNAGKDFVIVTSAGNDSSSINIANSIHESEYNNVFSLIEKEKYPEIYDRIIVVGNCTKQRGRYKSSNAGKRVDLWAVGVDIYSTVPDQEAVGSDRHYSVMTGTSQAAPYVTGTAAMVWTLSPGMKGSEVKKLIVDTSSIESPVLDMEGNVIGYEYKTKAEIENDHTKTRGPSIQAMTGRNVLDAERAVREAINRGGWGDAREAKYATMGGTELLDYYVRSYLMLMYGLAPERTEAVRTELKASDVKGLIGWDIRDHDDDGEAELAVLRAEYDEADGKHDLRYIMEIYEVYNGSQVTLQDRLILEKGLRLDVTVYPNIQAGLFSYSFMGRRYFAWGLDAYTQSCSAQGHVFRTGVLTYNGRCLQEVGECGFGAFEKGLDLQLRNILGWSLVKSAYGPVSDLAAKGLSCTASEDGVRLKQVILLDEDARIYGSYTEHFHEIFNVQQYFGPLSVGEAAQPVGEQCISLRIREAGEREKLDITVWPEHPKPSIETLDITVPTPGEAFLRYLKKEAPNWDIMPTDDMLSVPESGTYPQHPSWSEDYLYGFLSADIRDYDADGQEEMLLVWITATPGEYSQAKLTLEMQMYEYSQRGGVELRSSKWADVDMLLLAETLWRPEQVSLFTYRDGDEQVISVDAWESMNDTVSILACYTYDGESFLFRNGLSCEQYGQGDYIIRTALRDPLDDLPMYETVWTCLYSDSFWLTEYEWYTEEHDYSLISEEELNEFRDLHKALAARAGLSAQEEIRSGFMGITDLYAPRGERRDVSASDVYSAQDGSLTGLASVILYCDDTVGDGRYVLHRRDWQRSLDAWR